MKYSEKILRNSKLILEIPRFILKFRNAIAKQNSGIFLFSIEPHYKKKFDFKPELIHDPYPYERFEADQLPNLEKESLKFNKEQHKFEENENLLHITSLNIETYQKI